MAGWQLTATEPSPAPSSQARQGCLYEKGGREHTPHFHLTALLFLGPSPQSRRPVRVRLPALATERKTRQINPKCRPNTRAPSDPACRPPLPTGIPTPDGWDLNPGSESFQLYCQSAPASLCLGPSPGTCNDDPFLPHRLAAEGRLCSVAPPH